MKDHKAKLRRRVEKKPEMCAASEYVSLADEMLSSTEFVVAVIRCSEPGQEKHGSLADQAISVLRFAKKNGIIIIAFLAIQSSGSTIIPELKKIARYAKRNGASILVESACRILRSVNYQFNSETPVLPTRIEWETLTKKRLCGVPILSILPPDLPDWKVKKHQQDRSNALRGRPPKNTSEKKEQKRVKKKRVLISTRLGLPISLAAELNQISKSTAEKWVKNHA